MQNVSKNVKNLAIDEVHSDGLPAVNGRLQEHYQSPPSQVVSQIGTVLCGTPMVFNSKLKHVDGCSLLSLSRRPVTLHIS